jgi:hypothetical protein
MLSYPKSKSQRMVRREEHEDEEKGRGEGTLTVLS